MKRVFFLSMLMLVTAVAINAQSLTGKQWYTKLTSEDNVDIVVALAFDKSGVCEMVIATEYNMKEDNVPINLDGSVTVPGTFTLNGSNLTVNFDKSKAEVDLDYEIKGMDAKTKELMDKQIRSEINGMKGEFKNMMLNGMPKMHNMEVVKIESKKLILKDDAGDEIPFYAE